MMPFVERRYMPHRQRRLRGQNKGNTNPQHLGDSPKSPSAITGKYAHVVGSQGDQVTVGRVKMHVNQAGASADDHPLLMQPVW